MDNEKEDESLAVSILRQLKRILRGIAWRIRYRYKPLAKMAFLRICRRQSYRWIPIRFNAIQKKVVRGIVGHKSYADMGKRAVRVPIRTISVVIPHYNQQEVLAETIESVLSQTLPPDEIIVVDDSSADPAATRNVLKAFSDRCRISGFFPEEKLFSGGSRNYGADRASGDLILFVDSDDILHPQRLEFLRRLFLERSEASFAITGTIPFTDQIPKSVIYEDKAFQSAIIEPRNVLNGLADNFASTRLSWIDRSTGSVPWYAWGAYGIHRNYQPHSGAISVRKDVWPLLRFSNPRNCVFSPYEDYEYCFLMQALTLGGFQIDLPLIFYRRGFTTHKPKADE